MAASKFTPEIRADVLERIAAGAGIRDAADAVGIREATVRVWLTKGNAGNPRYVEFAKQVAKARETARNRPEPMDAEEYREHLDRAVRAGSVQAMKLWWEVNGTPHPEDPAAAAPDPMQGLDELAERRANRS